MEKSSFEEQIHSRLRELTHELRRIRRELSEEIRHRPAHSRTPPEQIRSLSNDRGRGSKRKG